MNILSIDFDWIMEPTINSYNNFSHPQENWTFNTWRDIKFEIPEGNFSFNPDKYYQLLNIIINFRLNCKDLDYIYTGLDHHFILDAMKFWNINKEESILLCNIDHHHDCGYIDKGEQYLESIEKQNPSLANWVYYFCKEYNTTQYLWIKNDNSMWPPDNMELSNSPLFIPSSDIASIRKINFDRLFICLSPDWVPPKYYPMYNVIEDIIRLRPKIDNLNKK